MEGLSASKIGSHVCFSMVPGGAAQENHPSMRGFSRSIAGRWGQYGSDSDVIMREVVMPV